MSEVLNKLAAVLESRKGADPQSFAHGPRQEDHGGRSALWKDYGGPSAGWNDK